MLTWLTVVAWISIGIALIACNVILFDIFVRGHGHRWPLYASVAVLGCGSLVCFFAGSDEWTEQYTEGVASVHAASVHARFAIELCASWSVFSRIPLLTLFLLFAVRLAEAMLKRPVERQCDTLIDTFT